MSFLSFEYALLLPAAFVLWRLLPGRARLAALLVANYVFYCYGHLSYGWIVAVTTLVDYTAARAMEQMGDGSRRRLVLGVSLATNLGMLGYFKYSGFALGTLRALTGQGDLPLPDIVLPAGISFYTFQAMAYTIDVYRRRIPPTRDLFLFASYVSFFPQLVAGPIERPDDLLRRLRSPQRPDLDLVFSGLGLILVGLGKKAALADRLAPFAYPVFLDPSRHDAFERVVAVLLMSAALYLDFSAYTDIARGSARCLGVELSRNFLFPFAARNPGDFWGRWHATLTRWMREYLFVALPSHPALSLILPAVAIGLWHGASWNFVLWGLGNGLSLAAYVLWRIHGPSSARRRQMRLIPWLGAAAFRIYTVLLAPLFFCPDLRRAGEFWAGLASGSWASANDPAQRAAAIVVAAFIAFQFAARDVDWPSFWGRVPTPVKGLAVAIVFYVVLFGSVPDPQQFVYVQF